jgi:ribonuclease HI
MDTVQQIAEAIAALQPADKQRLLRMLAEQGDPDARSANAPGLAPLASGPACPQGQGRPAQLSLVPPGSRARDYLVVFDGGSKGNPGLGYGSYAITRARDGAQRLERLKFGDGYTNNEAEYDTLIAALRDLISCIEEAGRQPQEFSVEVRGDSALVIYQLQGKWKVREPRMQDRRDKCFRLLRRFGSVELKTQPREESVRTLGH